MLEWIMDVNRQVSIEIGRHIEAVALALVATCLVIYGDKVNRTLKKAVSAWVFPARVLAFVLMCTFGYGLLTIWLQPLVVWGLKLVGAVWWPLIVSATFLFLGVTAERKRYL